MAQRIVSNDSIVSTSNPLPVTGNVSTAPVTVTDASGTITLGGTDQLVFAANATRRGLMIQNQSTSDLYLNAKGGAATTTQPSIWLPAGSFYLQEYGQVSGSAVRIIGATTGQAFVAEEYR